MRQVNHTVRIPAPSPLAFRLHRLFVSRPVRRSATIILALLLILGVASVWLAQGDNFQMINAKVETTLENYRSNPNLAATDLELVSASPGLERAVREKIPFEFPVSPFNIDFVELKKILESIPSIESASASMGLNGIIRIEVVERVPVLFWKDYEGTALLDKAGTVVAVNVNRQDFPALGLVAGENADAAVSEALAIYAKAVPIKDTIRGLVRVGERRWDMVLDRNRTVKLPEAAPAEAVMRLMELNRSGRLRLNDIFVVDMRNPERITVRKETPRVRSRLNL